MKFVGRRYELAALDSFSRSREAGLMILYGRRRIGKTHLLSHWLTERKIATPFFWTATAHTSPHQLRKLTQALLEHDPNSPPPPSEDYAFRDWEAAFRYIGEIARRRTGPAVFIIDEFTNLVKSDEGLASVLQQVWDHHLSKIPNLRLILTGSLIAVMQSKIIGANAPLYGRATKLLHLRPLSYGTLKELLPDWTPAARVATYAVCGGIPGYLEFFAGAQDFNAGLLEGLSPGSLLLSDVIMLLQEQLKETLAYATILDTIAAGFHVWQDIVRMTKLNENSLNYYLRELEALELVQRRVPLLSPASRRARYHISDPFIRFYYRFIESNIDAIQRQAWDVVLGRIDEDLRGFIGGYVWEELCREWTAVSEDLGFHPAQVGSYWEASKKNPVQLDVVAADGRHKQLFVAECKWAPENLSRRVLTDLIERSQRMPTVTEPGWKTQYGLFSRAAFTPATRESAKELGVLLIDLAHLEDQLVASAQRPPALPTVRVEY